MVLRIKKNFIKFKNYFLIYLNYFYKLFSKNLVAKIAKAVIFNIIFNLQFFIFIIWICIFYPLNIKVLILILIIKIKLNNFLLTLIIIVKL